MSDCESELCRIIKKEQLRQIFKNTYGKEPSEEELKTFEEYLKSIGKWK